jgi:phospholipase C
MRYVNIAAIPRVAALIAISLSSSALATAPAGAVQMPINHSIVLMQENRAFDSYFGQVYVQGQPDAVREPWAPATPIRHLLVGLQSECFTRRTIAR